MTYTVNIAQNPGLQLGLSGYASINSAVIEESPLNSGGSLFGNAGLFVETPGVISGEGVITPASQILNVQNHTFSVYIQGITAGSVTIYAVANPGGTILGSVPLTLEEGVYQRAVINNIPVTAGQTLYLMVTTTSAESVQFWITNVQIEPDPIAHPYCDGNQPGCSWIGAVGGASTQQYQNSIQATANNINASNIVVVLVQGEAFNIGITTAVNINSSSLAAGLTAPGPLGAMTDFGIFSLTDPDPAQTYVSWNTAGDAVPNSGYSRSYGVFVPPQDYFVSNGQQLYERAAFMSSGWAFSNVPANGWAELADVQVEISPIINNFAVEPPNVYNLPRALQVVVKPNRLNFCTNPGIEVSTANWTPIGGATLAQDTTVFVPVTVNVDDFPNQSTASMNVTVTTTGDGAQINLTSLIVGDEYIVSAYVQAGANIGNIFLSCANGTTNVISGNSGTGYGDVPYGSGFYSGIPTQNVPDLYGQSTYGSGQYGQSGTVIPIATGIWYRLDTTFVATADTLPLQITCNPTAPTNFWVDNILVEAGQNLGDYFDGNFGTNYFWEEGQLPGLGRSYFYDQFFVKQNAVQNVLIQHNPLGISFLSPFFDIPYSQ